MSKSSPTHHVIEGTSGRPISFSVHLSEVLQSPIILFLHGFKGFKDWGQWPMMAAEFARQGFTCVRMNFSHNGVTPDQLDDISDLEAFSENTFSKELSDVQSVLNWLCNSESIRSHSDIERITIAGHSRGGAIAIATAVEDARIKSIFTLSSVGTLVRFSDQELNRWKEMKVAYAINSRTNQKLPMKYSLVEDYLANQSKFEPKQATPRLQVPFFIIHAEEDEAVPLVEAQELVALNEKASLYVIKKAQHSFGGKHPYTENELPLDTKTAIDSAISFLNQTYIP